MRTNETVAVMSREGSTQQASVAEVAAAAVLGGAGNSSCSRSVAGSSSIRVILISVYPEAKVVI